MDGKLTKTEQKSLVRCEQVIETGMDTYFQVGQALWDIREGRLYRARYETFEQYCAERWEFSRGRAYQLITAAETAAEMSTIVDTPPRRESHVRPLLNVPKDHRAEVWQAAIDAAPRDESGRPLVTAAIVEAAVERWHDGRKATVPEPIRESQAEVIDVDSRPVEPARNQYLDEIPVEEDDTDAEVCPECGSAEIAEDEEGRYCAKCKAPIDPKDPDAGETDDSDEDAIRDLERRSRIIREAGEDKESDEDAWLRTVEESLRELFPGRLAIGCARLEMLIERVRAEL